MKVEKKEREGLIYKDREKKKMRKKKKKRCIYTKSKLRYFGV